jgi:hypothetical protein
MKRLWNWIRSLFRRRRTYGEIAKEVVMAQAKPRSLNRQAINLNTLAQQITAREGKKVQVNIGQTKEILRVTVELLANEYPLWQTVQLLEAKRRS